MNAKVTGKRSKHQELLDELIRLTSTMKPHSQLPSERQLSESLGVSRMTLRRAVEVLQNRGYLYTVPSRGLFVAEAKLVRTSDVTSFSEVFRHRGAHARNELHLADRVHATEEIAKALSIRKGEWIYRVEQSFYDEGIAMATETAYVPCSLAPGLLEQDLSQNLSTLLENSYERSVTQIQYRVRAVIPPEKFGDRLKLPNGAPTLEFRAIGITKQEKPIFVVISYKRGDKYDLTYQVEP